MKSGTYGSNASGNVIAIVRLETDLDGVAGMWRVSGDVFSNQSSGSDHSWGEFKFSWRMDETEAATSSTREKLFGSVSFSDGAPHPDFQLETDGRDLFVNVEGQVYICSFKGSWFRKVTLRFGTTYDDIELPPDYTGDAKVRSNEDQDQTLIESLAEAGVELTVHTPAVDVNDQNDTNEKWSLGELHGALNKVSLDSSDPVNWEIAGLLVQESYVDRQLGIMFDTGKNNSDDAPRQGFAVFRNHDQLSAWAPERAEHNNATREAARMMFFTWMHEISHTFNLHHSFEDKRSPLDQDQSLLGRQGARTWTNYPYKYNYDLRSPQSNSDAFWEDFKFRFDKADLKHLRHAYWRDIAIGVKGSMFESSGSAMTSSAEDTFHNPGIPWGNAPTEVLIRSQGVYEHLEPVTFELRLRNLDEERVACVPERSDDLMHSTSIFVQQPSGNVKRFHPIYQMCTFEPTIVRLCPAYLRDKLNGADRRSYHMDITFGTDGFLFEEPGNYKIKVIYHGRNGQEIQSQNHKIRVCAPETKTRDKFAWDYLDHRVGMVHALKGSRANYLAKGYETMEHAARYYEHSNFGSLAAGTLSQSLSHPFKDYSDGHLVLKDADPESAMVYNDKVRNNITARMSSKRDGLLLHYSSWACRRLEIQRTSDINPEEIRKDFSDLVQMLDQFDIKDTAREETLYWADTALFNLR